MGMGCTRAEERVSAAVGLLAEAPTRFEAAQDVAGGGVLWALPALVANGLLEHTRELFQLPKGFYSVVHVFLLLGYMALARIRTMEQLRYHPPGEWGKLLGLDRVPEVRTLRQKVKVLAEPEAVGEWGQRLSHSGWERSRERRGRCMWTGMCGSIMASRRNCRGGTWRGSGCACGGSPTTG